MTARGPKPAFVHLGGKVGLEANLTDAAQRMNVGSLNHSFFEKLLAGRMEKPKEARKSSFKSWVYAIFIWAFLCVWLSGMTAGLMAGACKNDRYEGVKKLRFCNISLISGAWMKFAPIEQAKGSIIQLERGIALSQVGKTLEAAIAFEKALRDARAKPGPWERELHQPMVQIEDRGTLALWVSVVQMAK
ncbi:MAG: hypothetical protein CML66_06115 [Rhodobacteraceae bacterium]|nr:hypothetical protein [Paracoccaceae bacterium]